MRAENSWAEDRMGRIGKAVDGQCDAGALKSARLVQATLGSFRVRALLLMLLVPAGCWSQSVCPRPASRSTVVDPPALYSENGKLTVDLTYQTAIDGHGQPKFCFTTLDGKESPTLYLNPGDQLTLRVKNLVPADAPGLPQMKMAPEAMMVSSGGGSSSICGAARMTSSSVNVHYHGMNVSPACHSDEVIHTLINSGQTFEYQIKFPSDEPPGLYYYHPHVHGLSEAAVQGGATGLIVIQGIENVQPLVAGLPQRLLNVRDYPLPDDLNPPAPAANLSLNYVPVPYPAYPPAVINARPQQKEFWRLANTAADTILDVELTYDGIVQPLKLVALDGVPTGSQDGTRLGKAVEVDHIRIPTAGRVEFIVTTPGNDVKKAMLMVRKVNTGPVGDNDPSRPLATVNVSGNPAPPDLLEIPTFRQLTSHQMFEGLAVATPTAQRKLYFSEENAEGKFFITVDGEKPKLFNPNEPPAIVTHQGAVEDWTIENRTQENHEFHIHQRHFLLLAENGVPVSPERRQFLDTVDVPFSPLKGPYSSVTVRMDFRGPDLGDFVYHCHILEHEDGGMMAIIRVLPREK